MSGGTGRWAVAVLLAAGAGCGDVTTQPGSIEEPELRPNFEFQEEAPEEVPEEYRYIPVYVTVTAAPYFGGGIAIGESNVTFVGPNGKAWVQLNTGFGSVLDSAEVNLAWYDYSGGSVTAKAQFALPSGQCFSHITAEAKGAVWKHFLAWKWGRKEATDVRSAECPPEECTVSGGGEATLRADPPLGSVCGTQTGPPGGGGEGPPPDDPDPDCHWERDFVVYTDGSWDWLGPWMLHCGYETFRSLTRRQGRPPRPSVSKAIPTAAVASQGAVLSMRLLGSGPLGSGRSIEVHRYSALDVDAVIRIDTTRATAADLETAFSVAEAIVNLGDNHHVGAIQGPPSLTARANSGPYSRAAQFLKALSRAAQRNSPLFGLAHSLDVTINGRAAATPYESDSRRVPRMETPTDPSLQVEKPW